MTIGEMMVKVGFEANKESINRVNSAINTIAGTARKLLGAIGIGLGLSQLNALAEQYGQIGDKINYAFSGSEDLQGVQQNILDTALNCRTAYSTVADEIIDLNGANEKMFPLEEATQFVENLNKLGKVAGMADSEISHMNTVAQQAIETGKMSSAQLTQLSKTAPAFIRQLAEGLGTTEEQVKKMAESGTLTAEKIKTAMLNSTESIAEAYEQLDWTISDAMLHIRDKFGFWVKDVNEMLGITDFLGKTMVKVFDKAMTGLNKVKDWIGRVSEKLGGAENLLRLILYVAGALFLAFNFGAIIEGIKTVLKLLSLKNLGLLGIIAAIVALCLVVEDFIYFMKGYGSALGEIFRIAGVDADEMRQKIWEIWSNIKTIFSEIGKAISTILSPIFGGLRKNIDDAFSEDSLGKFGRTLADLIEKIHKFTTNIAEFLQSDEFQAKVEAIRAWVEDLYNRIVNIWNNLKTFFGNVWDGMKETAQPVLDWLGEQFKKIFGADSLDSFGQAVTNVIAKIEEWTKSLAENEDTAKGIGKIAAIIVGVAAAVLIVMGIIKKIKNLFGGNASKQGSQFSQSLLNISSAVVALTAALGVLYILAKLLSKESSSVKTIFAALTVAVFLILVLLAKFGNEIGAAADGLKALGNALLKAAIAFAILAAVAFLISKAGGGAIAIFFVLIALIGGLIAVVGAFGEKLGKAAPGLKALALFMGVAAISMAVLAATAYLFSKAGKEAWIIMGVMVAAIIALVIIVGKFGQKLADTAPGLYALAVFLGIAAVGMALMAQAAIAMADAGWESHAALAIMLLGIIAIIAVAAKFSEKLSAAGVGLILVGAGLLVCAAAMWIMAQAATSMGKAGKDAWISMAIMIGGLVLLIGIVSAVSGPLLAGGVALVVFGAGLAICAAAGLIAVVALQMLVPLLPGLAEYGGAAALAILELGGAMVVFGLGAAVAGVGAIVAAAGLTALGAGAYVAGGGITFLVQALALLGELIQAAINWGADFVNNFAAGITSGIDTITGAVSSVASTIRSFLHFSVPDVGPLSDADTYGGDMMQVLADGITGNEVVVTDALESLTQGMSDQLDGLDGTVDPTEWLSGNGFDLSSLTGDAWLQLSALDGSFDVNNLLSGNGLDLSSVLGGADSQLGSLTGSFDISNIFSGSADIGDFVGGSVDMSEATSSYDAGMAEIESRTDTAMTTVADKINEALTNITQSVTEALDSIKEALTEAMDGIKEGLSETLERITEAVGNTLSPEQIAETLANVVSVTKEAMITVVNMVSEALANIAEMVSAFAEGLYQKIVSIANGIKEAIQIVIDALNAGVTMMQAFQTAVAAFVSQVQASLSGLDFSSAGTSIAMSAAAIAESLQIAIAMVMAFQEAFTSANAEIAASMAVLSASLITMIVALSAKLTSLVTTMMTRIKQAVANAMSQVTSSVRAAMSAMQSAFSSGMSGALSTTNSTFKQIVSTTQKSMDEVVNAVQKAVQKLKDSMNFTWQLPHLDMPHIIITGNWSMDPPSAPNYRVEWWREGGILTGATIFGSMGGKLLGGGEAGKEAVLPLSELWKNMNTMFQSYTTVIVDAVEPMLALASVAQPNVSNVSNNSTIKNVTMNVDFNNTFNGADRNTQSVLARAMERSGGDVTSELARALAMN